MEKTLIIMRHGKAVKPVDGQEDFDRVLSDAGVRSLRATLRDAFAFVGKRDGRVRVMSSPAPRAWQTAELVLAALRKRGAKVDKPIGECAALWEQDADGLLDAVKGCPAATVVVVGHNPLVEDLVARLAQSRIVIAPGGMAALRLTWDDEAAGAGTCPNGCRLLWFAQGPIARNWKTMVDIEGILNEGVSTVDDRLSAFAEDPDDIETLHKLRVSIRTLRSLVAFAKPWQDPRQNAAVQADLKAVVAETSRLRELDVFADQAKQREAEHLQAARQAADALAGIAADGLGAAVGASAGAAEAESGRRDGAQDGATAAPQPRSEFVAFCEDRAAQERARVLGVMAGKQCARRLKRASAELGSFKWKRSCERAGLPPEEVRARFDRMVAGLKDKIERIDYGDAELTHDIRKEAKRVRYSAERFQNILGQDAVGIAKSMTAHQDDLGAICDARANIQLISEIAPEDVTPSIAWKLALMRAENEQYLYTILLDGAAGE